MAKIEAARPRFAGMVADEFGLTIDAGPFGINSRLSLIGAKIAEAEGDGRAYHDAALHAYWHEGRSLAEVDVLVDLAAAAGVAADRFRQALREPQWEAQVDADIQLAHQYGLHAVPSLVFNNRYLVQGAQPTEVLHQVIAQAAS